MRVYLSGPIFTLADQEYNLRLAEKVRALGFEVYCPNESEPINNKERPEITARMIYEWDIGELENCNVVLCQLSEDSGTNWEAGYFDCLCKYVDPDRYWGIVGHASDMRFKSPPHPDSHGVENQAGNANALVIGGFQQSLGVYLYEREVLDRLVEVAAERGSEGNSDAGWQSNAIPRIAFSFQDLASRLGSCR